MIATSTRATGDRTGRVVALGGGPHSDGQPPPRVRLDDAISYLGPDGAATITAIAVLPRLPGDAARSLVVRIRDHDAGPGPDRICVPHWRVDAQETVDPREVLAYFRRLYARPASGAGLPAPNWERRRLGFVQDAIAAGGVLLLDAPTAGEPTDRQALFWGHVTVVAARGRAIVLVAGRQGGGTPSDDEWGRDRNARADRAAGIGSGAPRGRARHRALRRARQRALADGRSAGGLRGRRGE